ncbi:MAG: XdhC family protein [Sphingorhabdus sp.]
MQASGNAIVGAADHSRVLAAAREWAGAPMAIATVIQTWRSAPCPVGTHMLMHADGRFVGSVSGGCVEGDVLAIAAQVIASGRHEIRRYGVANDAAWEVGLPCGGDIVVLVQPVATAGFAPGAFAAIDQARTDGETLSIATDLDGGQSRIAGEPTGNAFVNLYHPRRRLLIVGAVDIAAALAQIAAQIDIDVTIIDPRERFLTEERFPNIILDDRWPDKAIAALRPDHRTAIVTLSHDIKIDDPALIAALASPAAYIGALGSKASHAARLDRLRTAGTREDELQRIEGPAGVAINSISAPEIALSIAGGMIRAFNAGLR